MAKKVHPLFFLFPFLAVLPHCQCIFSESRGFSLKLVRRDFLDTPPFPQLFNFTKSSEDGASYLERGSLSKIAETEVSDRFPDTIRPTITRSRFLFTIDATIGTPSRKRTFIFDPGSSLTWTQCTPCIHCFKQDYPLFDPNKSSSYKKLSPNNALARFFKRSNNGECIFNVTYHSGQSSAGIASVETFTFPSNKKVPESQKEVVFGCSNSYQGQFTSNTLVTGIMGMNRSPLSLIGQMGSKSVRRFSYCLPRLNSPIKSPLSLIGQMGSTSAQRFSYCLPPINSPVKTTLLRFGNDVKGRALRKTSFLSHIDYNYRVILLDISIAGRRLNLPTGTFPSGCMLDIGCGGSYITTSAYNEVLRALTQHFQSFNLTRMTAGSSSQGEFCYRLRRGFRNYPNMTFHFQGANFEIGPENLFRVTSDRFCLAMFGLDNMTILGAFQQQNVRFIYDIGYQKLFFAKEDCSQDKA
ncbi:hypothetical protein Pfo_014209 [Paulownia fortunei]|nr:hypothetical protein Pfo_014209 [Paulownia fortunei]